MFLLVGAYKYFFKHKPLLISLFVALVVAFALISLRVNLREDISDFLPQNSKNEAISSVFQHIGNSNKIVVSFENITEDSLDLHNSTEQTIASVDFFVDRLEAIDSEKIIPKVVYKADLEYFADLFDFVINNAPYFLRETDYRRIDSLVSDDNFVATQLIANKQQLMFPTGGMVEHSIEKDPLRLFSNLLLEVKNFSPDSEKKIVEDGYFFNETANKAFVFIASGFGNNETANNQKIIDLIAKAKEETNREFGNIKISSFGAPVIAVSNASQIKRDAIVSIVLAIILIFALLVYAFRNGRNIALIFVSVGFGWLFAMAVMVLVKSTVSAIAIGISSIFIGIAINYPLHFIEHLRHIPDKQTAIREIAKPLLIGNITTVGAFLSLLFINSSAMRDMGLFGSLLLIGTMIFVLIFLPHFVDCKPIGNGNKPIFHRIASYNPENNRWLLPVVFVLTFIFFFFSQKTVFQSDMNSINFMTEEQRVGMSEFNSVFNKNEHETIFYIAQGRDIDQALMNHETCFAKLKDCQRNGLIGNIYGIGSFVPSKMEQQKRLELWDRFIEKNYKKIETQLAKKSAELGFSNNAFEPFWNILNRKYTVQPFDYFLYFGDLTENYFIKKQDRVLIVDAIDVVGKNTAQIESYLNNHLKQSEYSGQILANKNIGEYLVESLSGDFNTVLWICSIIVFVFLTLSFRRIEIGIMAFLPLAISWIWILALMYLFGIEFNIVNIILATFIFGQGDDYTIFVTDGLIYENRTGKKILSVNKKGIIISAMIMFIGIGTLIFAKHPAMRSLAEVTMLGMIVVVFMAYLVPPLVFRFLTKKPNGEQRPYPLTISRFFASIYLLTVFLVGCIVITIYGYFLLKLFGHKNRDKLEKKRLKFHAFLQKFSYFALKNIPFVKFSCENYCNQTFKQQAVIIANHQSQLDLICLIGLNPKLIVLTNDRVWNNLFFGQLIRYASYYPTSDGIENNLKNIEQRIKDGYSILIFPEGTRSLDEKIGRFHRGAFYLAEHFKLDILPIVLHGTGDVLPKDDCWLRKGEISMRVLPRIEHNSINFGTNYVERSKNIRKYLQHQYSELSQKTKTAEYQNSLDKQKLIYS